VRRAEKLPSILDPEGLALLRSFVDRRTLFAFDLDGTLAPIVADPSDARIPDPVRDRLEKLCHLGRVVILTGRSITDARQRLGFEPWLVIGNHGAEGLPHREGFDAAFRFLCREWETQLRSLVPDSIRRGILVENKGLSLSVHYRGAADRELAQEEIVRGIQRLNPRPIMIRGKFVENLVPAGAPLKGDALLEIMLEASAPKAFFIGDDATDEEVFRLGDPRILGVRVGCEQPSSATWCLDRQELIALLLDEILGRVETGEEGRPVSR
jgi:trehalose 6-phosphate phosphatase